MHKLKHQINGRTSYTNKSKYFAPMTTTPPKTTAWILQDGHKAKKHQEWLHPCVVYLVHYAIVSISVFAAHDVMVDSSRECAGNATTQALSVEHQQYRRRQELCAIWAGSYAILQLGCRLWQTTTLRTCVLYEGTWLCNTTLVIGSLALWCHRPIITAAFCVTVGIDQLLWYVDVLSWITSGHFVVGVAKYLTWPSTPWATRLTCTHHLWTLPLFLGYAAAPLTHQALALSGIIMVLHVTLSRLMTPFRVETKYLNVNLSHELWKDISIGCLQISKDNPSARVYLVRLLWRWQTFNVLVFAVLSFLTRHLMSGPDPSAHVCYTTAAVPAI
jgi:hypothetical protein